MNYVPKLSRFLTPGRQFGALALACLVALPIAGATMLTAVQDNSVWTVHAGTPKNTHKDGELTIEVSYEYIDDQGKKHSGTKKSKVSVPKNTSQTGKRDLITETIKDDAPKVDGDPVYTAQSGLGNTTQVAPTPGPNVQSAKVKKIRISDKKTNERDTISKPPGAAFAVTSLGFEGEVAGYGESDGGSVVTLESNFLGAIDFPLEEGASTLPILLEIEDILQDAGALTLLTEDGSELYMILPEGMFLGIGSNDDSLATFLSTAVVE